MTIYEIFVTRLIPYSQLLSGIFGSYPRSTAPGIPFTVAGTPYRTTAKALEGINYAARDTLALVAAWLVSGARTSQDELDALALELIELQQLWIAEFQHLAKNVLRIKPPTWQNRIAHPSRNASASRDAHRYDTDAELRKRFQALGAAQARLIPKIHKVLGFTNASRAQWLEANVDWRHPLTEGGRLGRWRTLDKNSTLSELGKLMGHTGDKQWLQRPALASETGTARLQQLLNSLHELQPMTEAPSGAAAAAGDTAGVAVSAASKVPADALLPSNYAVARMPSGLISLTVTVNPPSVPGLKFKLSELPQAFRDSLEESEKASLGQKAESFKGSILQGEQLLEQARAWEAGRRAFFEDLHQRYVTYDEKAKRDVLRRKLHSGFTADERSLLLEMLQESNGA